MASDYVHDRVIGLDAGQHFFLRNGQSRICDTVPGVSLKKMLILSQEQRQSFWLCQKVGRCGQ